jgi:hypothetical protein
MTTSRKGLGAQSDSANDSATVVAEVGVPSLATPMSPIKLHFL